MGRKIILIQASVFLRSFLEYLLEVNEHNSENPYSRRILISFHILIHFFESVCLILMDVHQSSYSEILMPSNEQSSELRSINNS